MWPLKEIADVTCVKYGCSKHTTAKRDWLEILIDVFAFFRNNQETKEEFYFIFLRYVVSH